jgi:AraC-like DNA-binding protein/ligand-binding sensor protein
LKPILLLSQEKNMSGYKKPEDFNSVLSIDCAKAFHGTTGLGCTVSDADGNVLFEIGYGCTSCEFCKSIGIDSGNCTRAHNYGMKEAERFGGEYIYFCPMGLSCFVSPILGQDRSVAKITVGPFLMVDREDYVAYDLQQRLQLSTEAIGRIYVLLDKIKSVTPKQVEAMSNLLFMAVGFLNNVSDTNRMLERQDSNVIQGQIAAYILELKKEEAPPQYPLEMERELVDSIVHLDKKRSKVLLNNLLGFVLFSSGGDIALIKTRIYELLVVISRAAMEAGASTESSYKFNHEFIAKTQNLNSIDELYLLLNEVMIKYIDSIFRNDDIKHIDVIHKVVDYISQNYSKKITLEDVAAHVYLSASYLSKIFKQEMGRNFTSYLNEIRIEKSKTLLLQNLKLVDIASLVGFEDQSYFTKVFKRITGLSPRQYRARGGRS